MSDDIDVSSRIVAFRVLERVRRDGSFANLLLPAELRVRQVHGRDAAFATDLTYGCLRWRGLCDAVVSAAAKRPCSKIDPAVLDVLRLGAYQSLFMAVPAYAVVSSSVTVARRERLARQSGFVNAVMRAVTARGRQEWEALVVSRIPKGDRYGRLAVRYSHPRWIVERLDRSLQVAVAADPSLEGMTLEQVLSADDRAPAVTVAARPGLMTPKEVLGQLPHRAEGQPGLWSPFAVRVKGVDPGSLPAVRDGLAGVEDEGSQLAALTAAMAPLPEPGTEKRWLDLCAGPGGKTAMLAAVARQRDIVVRANEPVPRRAQLVRDAVRALADTVPDVTERDGRDYDPSHDGLFDRVLVDVPCSGLGALRRRPEARWTKRESDIADLANVQKELLAAATLLVRPGGLVAYVTCSPVLEETRAVVDAVLAADPSVRRLDAAAAMRAAAPKIPVASQGDVQLLSAPHDTDMMFVSLLTRN
ncbi:MAG: 16S rRNA methyltransferase [Aeriscardovia sp.]|nr:16S rRNA methyltransferase [Aeriscardovia sp.]